MYQLLTAAVTAALLSSPVAVASTHPASCTVNYQPASIVHSVAPEYPEIAKAERITGTTVIRVDLSETGRVKGSSVAVSSGSMILDQAALRTAQSMVYAPEILSCRAVPGSYAVEVEFAG